MTSPTAATLGEAVARIGQPATLRMGGIAFQITITDVKLAYGNLRYLCVPVTGTGQSWLGEQTITFAKPFTKEG